MGRRGADYGIDAPGVARNLALLDFRHTAASARNLRAAGLDQVSRSGLRFGIFPPVRIVTGRKAITA